MREACVTVGYTGCEKNGHIPGGTVWTLTWLPKGYAPTAEDRLLAVFFDTDDRWEGFGLQDELTDADREEGRRLLPPLLRVVKDAIEKHLREHPEDVAGHLESKDWSDWPTLDLSASRPIRAIRVAGKEASR